MQFFKCVCINRKQNATHNTRDVQSLGPGCRLRCWITFCFRNAIFVVSFCVCVVASVVSTCCSIAKCKIKTIETGKCRTTFGFFLPANFAQHYVIMRASVLSSNYDCEPSILIFVCGTRSFALSLPLALSDLFTHQISYTRLRRKSHCIRLDRIRAPNMRNTFSFQMTYERRKLDQTGRTARHFSSLTLNLRESEENWFFFGIDENYLMYVRECRRWFKDLLKKMLKKSLFSKVLPIFWLL